MKLVIQRVNHANVKIDGEEVGKINKGLLVLVGVAADDDEKVVEKYFNKLIKLRIFEDENGKTNLSLNDVVELGKKSGIHTECGVFGADMKVSLENDGPFTIVLEL